MMTVYPAIDLMQGHCVRLKQGRYEKRTIYEQSPLAMARLFERMGYEWLHVIDLDGAKVGSPQNLETVRRLMKETSLKVQLGGGLRTYEAIVEVLESGVARVLIGSMAVQELDALKRALRQFGPDRIVVAMDVKDGEVKVSGWLEGSSKAPHDFVKQMVGLGVSTILCTDISRDGMMCGPNVDFYRDLVATFPQVTWIAAGGVGSPADRKRLQALGIQHAVVGKAFYEGSFLAKRVIPCLDVKDGRTVKGVSFTGLRDAGDPVQLAERYEAEGADELVFLDIAATSDKRAMVADLARRVAKAISIPFTIGGGIRSMDDIRSALQAGADKVSIESAAVTNPDLISEAARYFGSQAIVVSISPKRVSGEERWMLTVKGGREDTGVDLFEFLKDMQARGAGEILLNSVDEDGRGEGYDLSLLKAVSEVLKIPLIASSGAGELAHFYEAIVEGRADAVLGASVFHYGKFSVNQVKLYLDERAVPVRLLFKIAKGEQLVPLSGTPPSCCSARKSLAKLRVPIRGPRDPNLHATSCARLFSPHFEFEMLELDFSKGDGLIPAIIQDVASREVLMLGFMNQEAYQQTVEKGRVTFWSRTKQRLWQKGEASGHFLNVVAIETDCDRDALLILVEPEGPTCHTGVRGCFPSKSRGVGFLGALFTLVQRRKHDRPQGSYTTALFDAGLPQILAKVEEEAEEVVRAGRDETDERLVEETGDLLYHLCVLLVERGIDVQVVVDVLEKRHCRK